MKTLNGVSTTEINAVNKVLDMPKEQIKSCNEAYNEKGFVKALEDMRKSHVLMVKSGLSSGYIKRFEQQYDQLVYAHFGTRDAQNSALKKLMEKFTTTSRGKIMSVLHSFKEHYLEEARQKPSL